MKYIISIFLMAFIVSASVAQSKQGSLKQQEVSKPAAKDTVIKITLTLDQIKALLGTLEMTLNLLPRSADLTALQASEAQKQIYSIGKTITDQLPALAKSDAQAVPPAHNTKRPESKDNQQKE